jgi:7-cyano-7-deazaguanine synthase
MSVGMQQRAVVLLSGGLDSTTCLAVARAQGLSVVALSFDYQQRHHIELEAAKRVAAHYKVEKHYVFELGSFRAIGGSALTSNASVPKNRSAENMTEGVPVTYVPARNLVFLSHATGVAEVEQCEHIFIGVNAIDYSGYPDCRPEFIEQFQRAATLATRAGTEGRALTIQTPLLRWTKAEIVRKGLELGAPFELTHSCYSPVADTACGQCDSCILRLKGFSEAGVPDPIRYAR